MLLSSVEGVAQVLYVSCMFVARMLLISSNAFQSALRRRSRATSLQNVCNKHATFLQYVCNICATQNHSRTFALFEQQTCNIRAKIMQHVCNIHAMLLGAVRAASSSRTGRPVSAANRPATPRQRRRQLRDLAASPVRAVPRDAARIRGVRAEELRGPRDAACAAARGRRVLSAAAVRGLRAPPRRKHKPPQGGRFVAGPAGVFVTKRSQPLRFSSDTCKKEGCDALM